jgi:ubiquinone/menaquinone biosynthesis C-methylase UbiE
MQKHPSTAWQAAGKWYNEAVGEQGHYYHQAFIIKNVLKLLQLPAEPSQLIDLACGQGVLSRHLPSQVSYVGVDAASDLIAAAQRFRHPASHQFVQGDVTRALSFPVDLFTHGTLILALQNIDQPLAVFKNAARLLKSGAPFIIVLNHPHFRIPRQSSWKVDEANKMQYRRIDRYMSPMKIPIQTNPGQKEKSTETWSFHHPLTDYSRWLAEAGFTIDLIEEWCSDKVSEGRAAKMENRSREEFPLFMTLVARKK